MNRLQYIAIASLTATMLLNIAAPLHTEAKPIEQWLPFTSRYENGLTAIEQHNYGDALRIFKQLATKHPSNPRYIYDLALTHQRLGQVSEANTLAQQLKTNFPHSVEAQTITAAQQAIHAVPQSNTAHYQATASTQPTPHVAMPAVSVPAASQGHASASQQRDIQSILRSLSSPQSLSTQSSNTYTDNDTYTTGLDSTSESKPINTPTQTASIQSSQVTPNIDAPKAQTNNTQDMQNMMQQMMIMNMMGSMGGNNTSQQGMGGMNAMMGGGQTNNNNNSMMMMLPLMMQQMNGAQGDNGNNPNANIDPDALSTMMMNQMMGSMDFGMGNNDKR